jgi:hypothetical protein
MMTNLNEPRAEQPRIIQIKTDGSPRWLQIVRDALLSVAALLFVAGFIWAAVAVNRAGDALSELGDTSTSEPCDPTTDPFCMPGD